ncbi:MAG: uncharacterized protein JWO12_2156 [Frankiales bacterium]|nr:uncharacterized protein [Frankiales bacterium]
MRLPPALAAVVLLLTACGGGGSSTPKPTAAAGIQSFTGLSHEHLKKGEYPYSYPQSPPVGGKHAAAWLQCVVYTAELPKENAVHSEEHGGIWLTYQPSLAAADIAKLALLHETSVNYVMVSPYPGQDSPVIASTWGLQLKVQSVDDPRLLAFIRQYAGGNQGGEQGAGCTQNGATLEQALAYDESLRG